MNNASHNMGFYASWARQTKLQQIAKPGISSGWTNIADLLFLTSSSYFQSAAARADGILIPNLHKALFVSCNLWKLINTCLYT
jgi:hypothetical protein